MPEMRFRYHGINPEGTLAAPPGMLVRDSAGRFYQKISGSGMAGWVPLGGGARSTRVITGTTHTLEETDFGKLLVTSNANPVTIALPLLAVNPGVVGLDVEIIQLAAGAVTVEAGLTTQLYAPGEKDTLTGLYSTAHVRCISITEFVIFGDIKT